MSEAFAIIKLGKVMQAARVRINKFSVYLETTNDGHHYNVITADKDMMILIRDTLNEYLGK